jgi:hypothetical protein
VVFCSLYIGAIEGTDRWFAPRHLYRMTEELAGVTDPDLRLAFYKKVPKSSEGSWYADNSREGARDEGVRQGLIPLNAMVKRQGVDTTSSKGRYALHPDFAALFDPSLSGAALNGPSPVWVRCGHSATIPHRNAWRDSEIPAVATTSQPSSSSTQDSPTLTWSSSSRTRTSPLACGSSFATDGAGTGGFRR